MPPPSAQSFSATCSDAAVLGSIHTSLLRVLSCFSQRTERHPRPRRARARRPPLPHASETCVVVSTALPTWRKLLTGEAQGVRGRQPRGLSPPVGGGCPRVEGSCLEGREKSTNPEGPQDVVGRV